ncbi:LysR family transcriptional regulator [Streptomyces sp. NPDC086010]|uniref:LysR family transcriptional regulator n=1 Tax=Streptomyces sp. NPDC086010 TaxID=3365745 RepID=UPI0037D676D2
MRPIDLVYRSHMFDTRHLRTFDKVVRSGSYAAAARELGCTQPAVAQQMKALEKVVGAPLLERLGYQIRLTEAGQTLFKHAVVALDVLETAREQLSALAHRAAGRVRVCLRPGAGAELIAHTVGRLADDHPDIRVELQEADRQESVDRVGRGECDLAVVSSCPGTVERTPRGVDRLPLFEERSAVLLHARHRLAQSPAVSLEELAAERWIVGCPECRAGLVQAYARLGVDPDATCSISDPITVQGLVAQGLGVAPTSRSVAERSGTAHVVTRPLDGIAPWRVSTFAPAEPPPAAALVLDALRRASATLAVTAGTPAFP